MSISQLMQANDQYQSLVERDNAIAELERGGRPGVSVVIPCFNQEDSLHRALLSVLQQTRAPFEVIIVDDGSDVEIVVPDEPDNYPHVPVRVVRVTNRGLAAARNTGLMVARGDAFLPLDADDWLQPDYIEKTYPLLRDADVVLTGIQEHGETRNGRYPPGYDRHFSEVTADLILDGYNRFYYCSLFRTEILRRVGGYNPKMTRGLEDADLWVDLLRRDARFAAVDEPLFNYSTNPNGMLQTIHRDGGYEQMVAEMHRHHR